MTPEQESQLIDEFGEKILDRWWRLNNLYYIKTVDGVKVQFKPKPVQTIFYKALHFLNIILKSRQHGITTFCCIMMLDMCLFHVDKEAGVIAHKLTAAYEILRNKVKFPYENLPQIIRDLVGVSKCNDTQMVFDNGSSIIVATSLRSGTYQWVHISEYGKICAKTPAKAEEIVSGTFETVHEGSFITIESTAEGSAGDFYDRCKRAERLMIKRAELGPMHYKYHFYSWYQDPKNTTDPQYVETEVMDKVSDYLDKLERGLKIVFTPGQRAWYAMKKDELGHMMYREHPSTPEEAFRAKIEGAYYGTEMAIAREMGRIGFVPYDKYAPVYTVWDLGHKHTSIWFVQFIRQEIRLIDYYYDNEGKGLPAWAQMLEDKKYRYGDHYAPWDVAAGGPNSKSMQTGLDFVEVAKKQGLDFKIIEKHTVAAGIDTARDFIERCWFDMDACDLGIKSLEMYRAEWDSDLGMYKDKPVHDWTSHGADAFRYVAILWRFMEINDEFLGDPMPEEITRDWQQNSMDDCLLNS